MPKAAWVILNNPLLTFPDSKETKRAFLKLEHIFVNEIFHTPMTEIADIVLPAAWMMEHDTCSFWPGWLGKIKSSPKIVEPPGEAWSDIKIVNELAKKCGYEKYFWETEEGGLDEFMKPFGVFLERVPRSREVPRIQASTIHRTPLFPSPPLREKWNCIHPWPWTWVTPGCPTFKDLLDVFTDRFELTAGIPLRDDELQKRGLLPLRIQKRQSSSSRSLLPPPPL